MKQTFTSRCLSAALTALMALSAPSLVAGHQIDVNVSRLGAPVQSTMYGIFFEDINYAADGGLYAEMVKNRSFEFPQHLMGWRAFGGFEVRDDGPFERNPHYVRLSPAGHSDKATGLENEGFFGIAVRKDATYRFSVWARCPQGGRATLDVRLVDNDTMGERQEFATTHVDVEGTEWQKYTAELRSPRTDADAALRIFLRATGRQPMAVVDVEHVSLFPTDTWKGRQNGMRRDLAQALADLRPGVFRFPGGCIVEGTDLNSRYQWKHSVGPVENRPLNENRWHYTFGHRFFPDYFQSYGLGFYEFFELCEDFGCEALPVVSCGLSCQFQNRNPEKPGTHVPLDQLDQYIQDALDLVEFANGDTTTTWGKVRAQMGHPAPFNLKYLGVGNEQWDYDSIHSPQHKDDPVFTARLRKFSDALRAKYPKLKLIGTTGPNSEGWDFDLLQPRMKELKVDLYDEHYYRDEKWFLSHGLRYDTYDRKGPRVFAGEYACHGKGKKWNHFETSLYEAAHMTGIERNADVVHMATYAPLFAHVKGWQWRPDAIWYDNLRSFRTVSYYVQQLFSLYKGTNVLTTTSEGKPLAGQDGQDGLFASAVFDKGRNAVVVKVVNTGSTAQQIDFAWAGKKKDYAFTAAEVITLHCDDMLSENTLDQPDKIVPITRSIDAATTTATIGAKTFQVYIFSR